MTNSEAKVVEIFAEALKCEDIGLDDEFIDLGGDSMSAMLCILRIRTHFQVELSVEDFFLEVSTVRSISKLVDQLQHNSHTI